MLWKYAIEGKDHLALFMVIQPNWLSDVFRKMLPRKALVWTSLGLALWLAMSVKEDGYTILFGIALVYLIQRDLRVPWILRDSLHRGYLSKAAYQVLLLASDDGLTEEAHGVRSFAPWSAMNYYFEHEERLFIQLRSEQWVIVPKKNLDAECATFADLIVLLNRQRVSKR